MNRIHFALLVFLTTLAGCSSGPESNIVGKWVFDEIILPDIKGERPPGAEFKKAMEETKMRMMQYEFFSDGAFSVEMFGAKKLSTYKITGDGKYLEMKLGEKTDQQEIAEITDSKMTWKGLGGDGSNRFMVWKKE